MSDFVFQGSAPLGSLRSELDEGSDLQSEFVMLESYSQAVRHAFLTGKVESAAAAAILSKLRLLGSDGAVWSIGATSGSWYRKSGANWVQTPPPYGIKVAEELPDWLRHGVANELSRAESKRVDKSESNKSKNIKTSPLTSNSEKVSPTKYVDPKVTEDDLDWVLQEWGMLPEIPGSVNPDNVLSAVNPNSPREWDPEVSIDDSLRDLTSSGAIVAPRVDASEVVDDKPFDEAMPQDFFLPPDEEK